MGIMENVSKWKINRLWINNCKLVNELNKYLQKLTQEEDVINDKTLKNEEILKMKEQWK